MSSPELYLLSCTKQGRYSTGLFHVDVKKTKCDSELMLNIKNVTQAVRRSYLPSFLRLRTVTGVEFINFELHRKQLVDIRKRDDIPPESRRNEYDYTPMPADLIPPIGRNYLTHIYHHPEDADIDTLCLDRFPKRKAGRLQRSDGRPVEGWGVHFIVGYDHIKLVIVGFFCVLFSAVFGVVWSVVRKDLQGAFTISAYILALLGLGLGSLQAFDSL